MMMIDECITKAANMSGDDSRTRSRYTIAVYGGGKVSAAGNAVYELKLSRTRKTTDNVVELGTRSSYFPRSLFLSRGVADWLILKARSLCFVASPSELFTSTINFCVAQLATAGFPIRVLSSYTRRPEDTTNPEILEHR